MRLPVLMYHDITENGTPDFLTITVSQLERQLQYLKNEGYQTISLKQFYNYFTKGEALPRKPVLITFDDGFKSNYRLLYPLLQKFGLKASIFLVADFIGKNENKPGDKYLHLEDLRQMNAENIDFGYHSFSHKSYGDLSIEEIGTDLTQMQRSFSAMHLDIVPLFAYTYGASPRKNPEKMQQLEKLFQKHGINAAFRIGNRINSLPVSIPYQIQRLDVRGTDPFWKFKLMLRFGKKWLA